MDYPVGSTPSRGSFYVKDGVRRVGVRERDVMREAGSERETGRCYTTDSTDAEEAMN